MKIQKKEGGICIWSILSILSPFWALAIVLINRSRIIEFSFDALIISIFISGLLAIIFGIIALVKIKKKIELKGKWLAIIGIIFGTLFIGLLFLLSLGWGQTEPIPLMK